MNNETLARTECRVCNTHIKTMCFRGTGFCGENCRKSYIKAQQAAKVKPIKKAVKPRVRTRKAA